VSSTVTWRSSSNGGSGPRSPAPLSISRGPSLPLDGHEDAPLPTGTRCIYICDWLPPDFGAVGQYSLQFARERADQGQDVLLVGFSSRQSSREIEHCGSGRLTIRRLKVRAYDKTRLLHRCWWTLLVNLRLLFRLTPRFPWTDEIVFTGSPPFMVHWVAPLGRLFGCRVIYRITDFYPECLMAACRRVPLALRCLYAVTLFWRRRVSVLEVLGEDQRQRLLEAGLSPERIRLKRDPAPVAIDETTQPLDPPFELANQVVLLYSGNLGVAHDVDTFAHAYIRHHKEGTGRVLLWLNAVGSGAAALAARLREANVPVVVTTPVPLERLASLLVTPHAHLITLRNEFSGFVMPSKVYGCLDSGKAVVYIGPKSSDVHMLCTSRLPADQYHQVEVGDSAGALAALEALADSRELVAS